jgi:hypothetical protein
MFWFESVTFFGQIEFCTILLPCFFELEFFFLTIPLVMIKKIFSELEISGTFGHVEDPQNASEIRSGTQGSDPEMSRRSGRVDPAPILGPFVRNGDQEELDGDRQEVDGSHGPGRRHYLSRRTHASDHPDLFTERLPGKQKQSILKIVIW